MGCAKQSRTCCLIITQKKAKLLTSVSTRSPMTIIKLKLRSATATATVTCSFLLNYIHDCAVEHSAQCDCLHHTHLILNLAVGYGIFPDPVGKLSLACPTAFYPAGFYW